MTDILTALKWRYATKQFDTHKKLSQQEVDDLLEAARLAPSSFGLQPWGFVHVKDRALREDVRNAAWGQAQVTDASDLIVICAKTSLGEQDVEGYLALIARTRGVTPESLDGFRQMLIGFLEGKTQEQLAPWIDRQAYIALGTLLTAAAAKGIDACPMEGFSPADVDRILGLDALGLRSLALCPVGHRSPDDKYAHAAKVRAPRHVVVFEK